jgi:hypothetical protein
MQDISDISIDRNDFDAGFLITFRKNLIETAKSNGIWTKNYNNNNNSLKLDVNRCF